MTISLPPNPGQFRNLHDWARQLYEFMVSQSAVKGRVEPLPIIMAQRQHALDARAAQDGILLFDPSDCSPIVSIDGMWYPLRESPLFELEYVEAFNVDGGAISTGGDKIPFNTLTLDRAPWATFNPGTEDFDLTAGEYYLDGYICITKTSGGAKTVTGYLAEASDLTTPVGDVNMAPVYIPSSAPNDSTIIAPIRGQVDIATDGTYALVVNTSGSDIDFGKAHGISGFDNVYASLGISKIGLNE